MKFRPARSSVLYGSTHRFGEQSGPWERFDTKTNLFPLWWQGNISHQTTNYKYLGVLVRIYLIRKDAE
jgi:hypothetical protein